MENTTHSLENLFKLSSFRIPQYQRAYAWETEPQLVAFLDDLRQQTETRRNNPSKDYFLGTLLLHEVEQGKVHVVDGQQRLTTSVLFVAAALRKHDELNLLSGEKVKPKALRSYFIYDSVEETQKFRTIEEDNPFFSARLLGLSEAQVSHDSPSSLRLRDAFDYFLEQVQPEEWEDLLQTLVTAKVMVYSVTNSADATLIFELQNDRGKRLTDLEALKSYLMHLVYLNSKNPEDKLGDIQTQFAKIYRTVESLDGVLRAPSEDAVLSYHCAANLRWTGNDWRNPKELIKKTVRSLDNGADVTGWVLKTASDLRESFAITQTILSKGDIFPEFSELLLLDRMASFWPLILKAYRHDHGPEKVNFRLACRLMEVYAMRGYGIGNLRSDAGLTSLYTHARDFAGDFAELHTYLHSMSGWFDLEIRFKSGLESRSFYSSNRKDCQYLLWRYENHLRSKGGQAVEPLGWRQYIQPKDGRTRLSIEHIAAQSNPIAETTVQWTPFDEPAKFSAKALHCLGNLVLDSISANSAKGKYDFSDKLESLSKNSTFLSQGELIDWAEEGGDYNLDWTFTSIRKRQAHMIAFALCVWDPSTYFKPELPQPEEEEMLGQ